jgi:tight adherence protein C
MNTMILLLSFFAVVMAGIVAAGYYLFYREDGAIVAVSSLQAEEPASAKQILTDSLRSLGEAVPSNSTKEDPIRGRLRSAGYRSPEAVATFNGITYASAAMLGLIIGGAVLFSQESLSAAFLAAVCSAGFGYLLPKRVLDSQLSNRSHRLVDGLPTALDLLVLSVESGQALDQSIFDASREIRRAYPDLADELMTVSLSLRASASREQVFRDFAGRSKEAEFKKLANLLIDSDRFGSSLGPTLRTHARYLRIRRRQLAQEKARKISVKLVFPIFFLIFPSVLLVTLGPAMLQMIAVLKPMMELK